MSRRRTSYAKDFEADLRSGRGCGTSETYHPYLKLSDVPSHALRTRVPLLRFNRMFHVLSHSELVALLQFDWDDAVIDVKEQYPLRPKITIGICAINNIRPPSNHGLETVMTTDFLVTYVNNFVQTQVAYQIKATRSEAEEPRTAEKLLVEREYWAIQGIQWHLLVASEFNPILVGNLCELHQLRNMVLDGKGLDEAQSFWNGIRSRLNAGGPLTELSVLRVPVGGIVLNGYQAVKLLLARKRIRAPIDKRPIDKLTIGEVQEAK